MCGTGHDRGAVHWPAFEGFLVPGAGAHAVVLDTEQDVQGGFTMMLGRFNEQLEVARSLSSTSSRSFHERKGKAVAY